MSRTRTRSKTARSTKPSNPKAGKGPRKPLDAVAFSDEGATDLASHLRQIRHFYKVHTAVEIYEDTGEVFMIPEARELLEHALRFAATLNGAPARCRNKTCQGGRCHMKIETNDYGICGDAVCHGGIGERTIDDAAKMLGFLIEFAKRHAAWAFE